MTPEKKLLWLNIDLPPSPTPAGRYIPARLVGNMLYISGQGPRDITGKFVTGKLGNDVSTDEGYIAARNAGLQLLSAAKSAVGCLSNIEAVVKVFGVVNATPEFTEHAKVINGCSDLFFDILGDPGLHTRSVIGSTSMPLGMIVEIEAVFLVKHHSDL